MKGSLVCGLALLLVAIGTDAFSPTPLSGVFVFHVGLMCMITSRGNTACWMHDSLAADPGILPIHAFPAQFRRVCISITAFPSTFFAACVQFQSYGQLSAHLTRRARSSARATHRRDSSSPSSLDEHLSGIRPLLPSLFPLSILS